MFSGLVKFIVGELMKTSGNQFLSGGLVLGALAGVAASLRKIPGNLWDLFLRKFTVTLDVTSQDKTFTWLLLWFTQLPYTKKARRLTLKWTKGNDILIPAMGTHFFFWRGRPVWSHWNDEDGKTSGSEYSSLMQTRQKISLRILGRSREPLYELIRQAKKLSAEESLDKIKVHRRIYSSWDTDLMDRRSMNTVFLPKQAENILDDITQFLGKKEWYKTRGIPYRRGYLFHGPPGTGKSSAVMAIASELKMPLYVLNLGSIKEDGPLESAIREIDSDKQPVILLIEDIDTAIPSRKSSKEKNYFSLGTLLNCLDGIVASENVILVMTTNKKKSLDPALLRPGRIDRTVEFGLASAKQITEAITLFFPDGNQPLLDQLLPRAGKISTATLQELLVKHSQEE